MQIPKSAVSTVTRLSVFFIFLALAAVPVLAHQPALENQVPLAAGAPLGPAFNLATQLQDPTFASLAAYGRLAKNGEIDIYTFTVSKKDTIPFELLVPAKKSLQNFRPALALIEKHDPGEQDHSSSRPAQALSKPLPFAVPEGYETTVIASPQTAERETFYEPFSAETYFKGSETKLDVTAGKTYYLAVYEPDGRTGEYTIGLGYVENFKDVSFTDLIGKVLTVKLGLMGAQTVPWLDIIGLFMLIAGLIIGLGSVTVIDMLGVLGKKSSYWTEVAIKAHPVTKALIWLGIFVGILGAMIFFRDNGINGVVTFQAIIFIPLILNGLYLSLRISPALGKIAEKPAKKIIIPPKLQLKIAISMVFSVITWWSEVFFLVWYLLLQK